MPTRTTQQDGGYDTAATWGGTLPLPTDWVVINHNVYLQSNTTRAAFTGGTGKLTIGAGYLLTFNTYDNLENLTVDLNGGTLECHASWTTFFRVDFDDTGGSGHIDILGSVTFNQCDFSGCATDTTCTVGDNAACQLWVMTPTGALPDLTIWPYGGATLTNYSDFACRGFTYHASATGYDNNGKTVTVQGDLKIDGTSGFVGSGIFSHEGGDLKNDNSGASERFAHLKIGQNGGKSSMIGNVYLSKMTVGQGVGGVASEGGYTWYWYPTGASDQITQEPGYGSVQGSIVLRPADDFDAGPLAFTQATNNLRLQPTVTGKTVKMTGDWTFGGGVGVYRWNNGEWAGLDTNGRNLTCASLTHGYGAGARTDFAKVWLRNGLHRIGKVERDGDNASTAHELHLGSGAVKLTDYLDGTGLSVDAAGAVVADGEIRDVTLPAGNWLRAWGCKDGGGNVAGDRIAYTQRTIREAVPA